MLKIIFFFLNMYFSVRKAKLTPSIWEALCPEKKIVQEALAGLTSQDILFQPFDLFLGGDVD